MPFHATKPIECVKCHMIIATGEPISWTRGKGGPMCGKGVYHVLCPAELPSGVEVVIHAMEPGPSDEAFYAATEPDTDIELVEDEPLPKPGTRAWFATATMADREYQLIIASEPCVTLRDYNKVVVRYSTRLSSQETKRFRRYARGVWAGLTARFPEDDLTDCRQSSLFPESEGATKHGEETQAWRALVAEWATVPA